MRCCAGLDTHQTRRQFLEERQDIAALHLPADDHFACRVDAVDLKNRLRNVETDCRHHFFHARPPNHGHPIGDQFNATYAAVEEPSTASEPDSPSKRCRRSRPVCVCDEHAQSTWMCPTSDNMLVPKV